MFQHHALSSYALTCALLNAKDTRARDFVLLCCSVVTSASGEVAAAVRFSPPPKSLEKTKGGIANGGIANGGLRFTIPRLTIPRFVVSPRKEEPLPHEAGQEQWQLIEALERH